MSNTEYTGGVLLNLNYWDCECDVNYIHSATRKHCPKCNATQADSPNSRESEVNQYQEYTHA